MGGFEAVRGLLRASSQIGPKQPPQRRAGSACDGLRASVDTCIARFGERARHAGRHRPLWTRAEMDAARSVLLEVLPYEIDGG
jgi:hypothetical protein